MKRSLLILTMVCGFAGAFPALAQPESKQRKVTRVNLEVATAKDGDTKPDEPKATPRKRGEENEENGSEPTQQPRTEVIAAGEAVIQREREKAAKETEDRLREEKRASEEALTKQYQEEIARKEAEKKAALEGAEAASEERASQLKAEAQKKDAEIAEINKRQAELEVEKADALKAAAEAKKAADAKDAALKEAEAKARQVEADTRAEMERLRTELIRESAKTLGYLKPELSSQYVREDSKSRDEIVADLKKAVLANKGLIKRLNFCDTEYLGELFTFDVVTDADLGALLNNIRYLFGQNFLPDAEVVDLPVRVNVKDVPWNQVLRSQLDFLDLEARCSDEAIVITKRSKIYAIQEAQRKNAPLVTEFIKLKYLQPSIGGAVDVAGRSSTGGGAAFESLENQIQKILRDDTRASVIRVPGRNELIIRATDDQMKDIKSMIARADRPSYQVLVYGMVLTANENKLKDIGGQATLLGGKGDQSTVGGFGNLGGGSGSANGNSSGVVPGGVPKSGSGFSIPSGGITNAIFSTILGTNQFAAQLSLLKQQGVVKIENNPSIVTDDGKMAKLDLGRQIPVPINIFNGGSAGNANLQILNAGNVLAVTPQVIEDADGKPVKVILNLQLESNEADTTLVSQGLPSVQRRSIQNNFTLRVGETVVLGGFTTDSDTKSETKTPGLGDVPVIGNLFKRKVRTVQKDRLYFAIRVEVRQDGEAVDVAPVDVNLTPKLPENEFFKPYTEPKKKDN